MSTFYFYTTCFALGIGLAILLLSFYISAKSYRKWKADYGDAEGLEGRLLQYFRLEAEAAKIAYLQKVTAVRNTAFLAIFISLPFFYMTWDSQHTYKRVDRSVEIAAVIPETESTLFGKQVTYHFQDNTGRVAKSRDEHFKGVQAGDRITYYLDEQGYAIIVSK